MVQQERAIENAPPVPGMPLNDDDLDTASPVPIDLAAGLVDAARGLARAPRRLVVRDGNQEIAALIPVEDLRLLLRLEEEELDRLDREEARRALDDPESYPPVPWEQVRREAGL